MDSDAAKSISNAEAHHHQGRHAEALEIYKTLIHLSPKVHYNIAVQLRALNRHQEALGHLATFLKAEPKHFMAWTNAGDSLREIGNHKASEVMFQRAFDVAPKDNWPTGSNNLATAHHNLSREQWLTGPFDEALKNAEKAVALNPIDPDFREGLGEMQLVAGNYVEGWPNYDARLVKTFMEADPAATMRLTMEGQVTTSTQLGGPLTTKHDTAHTAPVGASEASP